MQISQEGVPGIADIAIEQGEGPVLCVVCSHGIDCAPGGPLLVFIVIDDHLNGVISLPSSTTSKSGLQ